jgi:thioesterase domain-containing protein
MFWELSKALGPDQPLYGFQFVNAARNAVGKHRFRDIAASLIAEMKSVQPNGPYNLLGYSLGGTLALEMAVQLHETGNAVSFLGLLDSAGPGYPKKVSMPKLILLHFKHAMSLPANDRWQYLSIRRRIFMDFLRRKLPLPIAPPAETEATNVNDAIRQATDSVSHARLSYAARFFSGRITLFRTTDKPGQIGADYSDPLMGWGSFARSVDGRVVDGAHSTIFMNPHVEAFAEKLRGSLQDIVT